MSTKINVAGVWKEPTPKINVAGVWKQPDNIKINVAGVWKEVYTAVVTPTVSPRADGDTNLVLDVGTVTCTQGCDFDTDGDEWENTPFGAQTNQTVWKDSGDSAGAWVEFVRTSGTQSNWDNKTSGVRYNLGSDQRYHMSITVSSGSNYKSIIGYFRMWDAATGGNVLWTGSTVEWRCTATVQTGPCSLC